jgi:hypothetical protein
MRFVAASLTERKQYNYHTAAEFYTITIVNKPCTERTREYYVLPSLGVEAKCIIFGEGPRGFFLRLNYNQTVKEFIRKYSSVSGPPYTEEVIVLR